MKPAFDWLLLAFGAALAFVGVYWMWSGWDIVQVERGWVSVISGAIMLSGGVMNCGVMRPIASAARVMPTVMLGHSPTDAITAPERML